jgi:hypothetical protein
MAKYHRSIAPDPKKEELLVINRASGKTIFRAQSEGSALKNEGWAINYLGFDHTGTLLAWRCAGVTQSGLKQHVEVRYWKINDPEDVIGTELPIAYDAYTDCPPPVFVKGTKTICFLRNRPGFSGGGVPIPGRSPRLTMDNFVWRNCETGKDVSAVYAFPTDRPFSSYCLSDDQKLIALLDAFGNGGVSVYRVADMKLIVTQPFGEKKRRSWLAPTAFFTSNGRALLLVYTLDGGLSCLEVVRLD